MKKLLILTSVLLVMVALLGGLLLWFVGVKTEQQLRQLLPTMTTVQAKGVPRPLHTLVNYQRTLFGAQAITRLDVRATPLGAWVDELRFEHRIQHGPLVWRAPARDGASPSYDQRGPLLPVLMYWRTTLDLSALSRDNRRLLQQAFAAQQPLLAEGYIDYAQGLHYQARLAPWQGQIDAVERFELGGVQLSGQRPARTAGEGAAAMLTLDIATIKWGNGTSELQIPQLKLVLNPPNPSGVASGQRLSVLADDVRLQLAEAKETVVFNFSGAGGYRPNNDELEGEWALRLDDFRTSRYPLQRLDVTATFSGINAVGLGGVYQLQQRFQDMQAARTEHEETLEMPESRRALHQLALESEAVLDELLQALFSQLLQPEQSRLSYTLAMITPQGQLEHSAALAYAGTERSIQRRQLLDYGLADWLKLVRGRVQLGLDKAVVPLELNAALAALLQKQVLLAADGQYRMDLQLTGYDAELNGRPYAYERLAEKVDPVLPSLLKKVQGMAPSDMMRHIETQGLNDEVLQAMAADQRFSAETLELLYQLKAMNERLQ